MTSSSTLFVGSLPDTLTEEKLRAVFAPHGTITEVVFLVKKSVSGHRCAFVTYRMAQEAEAAITALHSYMIEGGNEPIIVRHKGPPPSAAAANPGFASQSCNTTDPFGRLELELTWSKSGSQTQCGQPSEVALFDPTGDLVHDLPWQLCCREIGP